MKNPAHIPAKGKSVISTFITYIHATDKHRGELVSVDFKVKGREIEYKYTSLKKRIA